MKRKRISSDTTRGRKQTEQVSQVETPYSGSLFSDLPKDVQLNILIRVSIKGIFVLKCVCKTWYDIVSDPEFANLHFDHAEVYPLIRTSYSRNGSKMVHLMQPNKDDFELNLGMCDHTLSKPGCVSTVHDKIEARFEVPKIYGLMKHHNGHGIVTCNGLLFSPNLSDRHRPIVCNPVTGEFINLPRVPKMIEFGWNKINYGFGFSPATNQYKVIRMSKRDIPLGNEAEVHILGTKTWKNIDFFTQAMPAHPPAYLNGFLYWSSYLKPLSIFSFDIEKERFGSLSAPPLNKPYNNVGVLGGELCICEVLESGVHVWTMKDNGTEKVWSKVFSFDHMYSRKRRYYARFRPIKYMNDGALLMFNSGEDALVYMDPKENELRFLKVCQCKIDSKVEAIAHIPSFVSLKHVLSGQNVKVYNVRSSCAKVDVVQRPRYHRSCKLPQR
ncbi:putative F-box/kelch-repeat protein At3g17570 [Euphorbia lathyris]|uniref:putative F-box/kelch-repeat protein At3g17570 n=1 Tax=Euphorbia lathyris TaxID=212925 RepID=UPI003313C1DA